SLLERREPRLEGPVHLRPRRDGLPEYESCQVSMGRARRGAPPDGVVPALPVSDGEGVSPAESPVRTRGVQRAPGDLPRRPLRRGTGRAARILRAYGARARGRRGAAASPRLLPPVLCRRRTLRDPTVLACGILRRSPRRVSAPACRRDPRTRRQ